MAATIKYKGATIASLDADATKVLKVGGKYCEGDIVVENVRDSEHGYKEWTVTISEKATSGKVVFATDSDIAAHYADDTAIGAYEYLGDTSTLVYHDTVSQFIHNRSLGKTIVSGNQQNRFATVCYISDSAITTIIGSEYKLCGGVSSWPLQANAAGELYVYQKQFFVPAGDYRVSFWW